MDVHTTGYGCSVDEHLEQVCQTMAKVVEISALACSIVVTLTTFIVIGLAVKQKTWSGLPIKIRIVLILYALHSPGTCFYFTMGLVRSDWDE